MTAPEGAPAATAAPDLTSWLSARYDEAEQLARAATPGPWTDFGKRPYGVEQLGYEDGHMVAEVHACDDDEHGHEDRQAADARFIAAHDPSWRLADIARKRAILAEHPPTRGWDGDNLDGPICERCCGEDMSGGREGGPYPCRTVRLLAAEFADAAGYQEGWKP